MLVAFIACNKPPYKPPSFSAKAYVIGRETSSVGEAYNYWLLDLTLESNTPQYGGYDFF